MISTLSESVTSDKQSRSSSGSEQEKSESYSGAVVMSRRNGRGGSEGDWAVDAKGDCSHVGQCASEEALYNHYIYDKARSITPQGMRSGL